MTRVANQGPTFMAFLQARGQERRGWIEMPVVEMVKETGINTHDLTKMLRAWRRLGLVRFTVHGSGNSETLSGIRLTQTGMAYQFREDRTMVEMDTRTHATDVRPETNGAVRHTTKRRTRPRVSEETKAAMQYRRDAGATLPVIAREFNVSEHSVARHTVGKDAKTPKTGPVPGPSPLTGLPRQLLTGLPLVASLRGRQDRLISAAAAIEADAPDLAESLMARAQEVTYTALEQEVLTLLDRIEAAT